MGDLTVARYIMGDLPVVRYIVGMVKLEPVRMDEGQVTVVDFKRV